MFVTTGTKRVPPVDNLGPLAEEYSLSSDWDDRWRTGGSIGEVKVEGHLDTEHLLEGIRKFAADRNERLGSMQLPLR